MNTLRLFSTLFSTTVLSLFSLQALALKVDVVEHIDENQCTLITTESCTNTKSEGLKACIEKHKEQATKKEANTIIITNTQTSKHRKPSLTGGIKSVTTTTVSADYYTCQVSDNVATNPLPIKFNQTIEDRLNTLNKLKEKNLITDKEYADKREEILSDL